MPVSVEMGTLSTNAAYNRKEFVTSHPKHSITLNTTNQWFDLPANIIWEKLSYYLQTTQGIALQHGLSRSNEGQIQIDGHLWLLEKQHTSKATPSARIGISLYLADPLKHKTLKHLFFDVSKQCTDHQPESFVSEVDSILHTQIFPQTVQAIEQLVKSKEQ